MSHPLIEAYFARLAAVWPQDATRDPAWLELRDHVEADFDETCGAGLDPEEAAKKVVASCGNEVQLAELFSSGRHSYQTRWIMRLSTAGVVAGILMVMGIAIWWPAESPETFVSQLQAQAPAQPAVPTVAAQPEADEVERNNQETRDKLATRMPAEFVEVKLPEVIAFLSDKLEVDFYLDGRGLADLGIDLEQPIFIKLREVRADMLLDLALRQLGGYELDYVVRDGIVVITSMESLADASEAKAYPVVDLLKLHIPPVDAGDVDGGPHPLGPGAAGGGGFGGVGGGLGGMPGGGLVPVVNDPHTPLAASALINVVERTVAPDTWESMGGSGTITYYGDMLIIRQSPRVHREVEQVLALLRATAQKANKK